MKAGIHRDEIEATEMTELRDRIAAAIDQRYNQEAIGHTYGVCLMAADTAIAELGLRQDTVGLIHRYVTEWQSSEEPRKLWDIFADADRASGE